MLLKWLNHNYFFYKLDYNKIHQQITTKTQKLLQQQKCLSMKTWLRNKKLLHIYLQQKLSIILPQMYMITTKTTKLLQMAS
jgi:hypothetical protein